MAEYSDERRCFALILSVASRQSESIGAFLNRPFFMPF